MGGGMKTLVHVLIAVSVVTLVLSMVTKFAAGIPNSAGMIAGVGPTGYLVATIVLLLLGANLALLELLKKK